MLLINGIEQDCLSATDRAVQFGDGCFTTARVRDGVVHLLEAHLARLHEGCERLMIPVPDIDTLRNGERSRESHHFPRRRQARLQYCRLQRAHAYCVARHIS